jgi:hypothetical protein
MTDILRLLGPKGAANQTRGYTNMVHRTRLACIAVTVN